MLKRCDIFSYGKRTYRNKVNVRDLVSFHVAVKETDVWVSADMGLENEARDLILDCRQQLENYIRRHPGFGTSLVPVQKDPFSPPMVREMIDATEALGVGPMASVAGAIAQHVAAGLLKYSKQVIVENGGDIFLKLNRPASISIFAGRSPLSERLGLLIPVRQMPVGVCASSATVGHSLSMGIADVVCIVSSSAVLADGAATAICNMIKRKTDLEVVAGSAKKIRGVIGGVAIVEDRMVTWGDMELIDL
jgi:ApbE superfamily uncharacterized protein (UPF0280 family)